jgi:hypothetical protein
LVLKWQEGVKNNQAWDCEVYQIAAALVAGVLRA